MTKLTELRNAWSARRRFSVLVTVFALALVIVVGLTPAAAQQDDLNAVSQQFTTLMKARKYDAALFQALALEASSRVKFGTDSFQYGVALLSLAWAQEGLAKYIEAEDSYKRAVPNSREEAR